MAYDLVPNNEMDNFRIGNFAWPALLEVFGYLFPFQNHGAKWIYNPGTDKRFKEEHDYPIILSNSGFRVTSAEAKIMARMTRNYVSVQRTLDDTHYNRDVPITAAVWEMKWPQKVHIDWLEQFEQFADWAERSGGFKVY
ncbi:hypothetical protein [Paenibacillus polymyxa]|uniref:hypothetical protein n=1 Tax=Paenibacillus polymyxa TaxID=1406 RepID=UPI001117D17B|nr:hypothetical protein [Paenibacillus polymyxa]QDA30264.1 hypothetical protein FGY93_25470 [Paenibacillus polymyxa]